MSGIILDSYHRYLNNKEIKLEEQIKMYSDGEEKATEEALRRKREDFSNYKVGDTFEFNYNNGYVSKSQEDKYVDDSCIAKGVITQRNENDFLIKVKIV